MLGPNDPAQFRTYEAGDAEQKQQLLLLLTKVVKFNNSLNPLDRAQLCFRDLDLLKQMGPTREGTIVKVVQIVRWQLE